ncbi:MAG TPA: winged helix-turn-helix domain-containing protein [Solirubrobacterales bacterium]|nr:winged helix-turn-helix domain-containing protein [Solirubrobacterales bacterium]
MAGKKKRDAGASSIIDPRIVKALSHPTRVQILATLSHRSISPAEFSREYGQPLSDVAYHFRKLEKLECAEVVRTVPVRGSTQHFYAGTRRPLLDDRAWKQLPKSIQPGISSAAIQDLFGRFAEAVRTGTFDARDDRHLSWTPLCVDEEGWEEMVALLWSTLEEGNEIGVRAAQRMAQNGNKGFNITFSLAGFESPAEADENES